MSSYYAAKLIVCYMMINIVCLYIVWRRTTYTEDRTTQSTLRGGRPHRGVQPAGGCDQGRCGSRCDEAKYCGIQMYNYMSVCVCTCMCVCMYGNKHTMDAHELYRKCHTPHTLKGAHFKGHTLKGARLNHIEKLAIKRITRYMYSVIIA